MLFFSFFLTIMEKWGRKARREITSAVLLTVSKKLNKEAVGWSNRQRQVFILKKHLKNFG